MNILLLTDTLDMGGAETHVLTLAGELKRLGHSVTVCSGGGRLASKLRRISVRHIRLPLGSRAPLDMLLCRAALKKLLKAKKFDTVHSHSRLASFLVSDLAKRYGALFVSTAHARFKLTPLRRRLSRWGDHTVAVGEDLKQYLVEQYRLCPENISVIPNGVDPNVFVLKTDQAQKEHLRIAFLSRLDSDCSLGAELLCRIAPRLCKEHQNIEIVIGGGGSELCRIRSLAQRANKGIGRDAVKCLGQIRDVPSLMQSCDLLVGVSRVAIEGGLCGASIVLCGNEGFLGEITESNFGYALASNFCARGCEIPSSETLYNSISSILCRTHDERVASAMRMRELFLSNCASSVCSEMTERIYQSHQIKRIRQRGGTLLCGYYGYSNMGDDALLRASIDRARKEFGDPIRALTKNGKQDSGRFGIPCASRSSPITVFRQIANCRRLILGGGTLLQTETSKRSFLYYASLLLLAKAMKKDRILLANGIGQIDGRLCRAIFKKALSGCQYIELRDKRSQKILKRLLPEESAYLACDLTESNPKNSCTECRAEYLLLRAKIDRSTRFALAIPKAKADKGDIQRLARELKEIKRSGIEILIVPMYERQDLGLCEHLCKILGARLMRGICFDDLCVIAGRSKRVLSMRYHGLVAAHLAGVKFSGVGRDTRLLDYCLENGGNIL